jgi:hypothetical protein
MSCGSLDSFKNILGDSFKNLSLSLKCMDNTSAAIAEQSTVAQDALTQATSALDPSVFDMLAVPADPLAALDPTAPPAEAPPSYDDMMAHITGIGGSLAGFASQSVDHSAALVEQLKTSIIAGQANSALDDAMAAQGMTPVEEPSAPAAADTAPTADPAPSDTPVDPSLGDYTEDPGAALADSAPDEKFKDITKQTASICKTMGKALQSIRQTISELLASVKSAVAGILAAVGAGVSALMDAVKGMMSKLSEAAAAVAAKVSEAVSAVAGAISDMASKAAAAIKDAFCKGIQMAFPTMGPDAPKAPADLAGTEFI